MTQPATGAARTVDRRRWTIGLSVDEGCRWVRGAAVAAYGAGYEMRTRVMAAGRTRIRRESRRLFRELASSHSRSAAAMAGVLAGELADAQSVVVQKLMAREPLLRERALCIAVHDPGLWHDDSPGERAYVSLCDAARLAELTGLSVIDALPARDLAQSGQGGPLLLAGYWVLLHHADRSRAIVELGHTARVTILPASRDGSGSGRITSRGAGPGMQLLNLVSSHLSPERKPDRGGRLAVQGGLREDLLSEWQQHAVVTSARNGWHPHGAPPRDLAKTIVQQAESGRVTNVDALCTATHLVEEGIAQAIAEDAVDRTPIGEIVITGPGRRHGLLWQQLAKRHPEAQVVTETDLGFTAGGLDPAAVAILAQLYLEQVPANQTAITGAQVSRVLGRLTPGSPQNWLRLVREMAKHQPVATLRSAI
jgi:anhydro-N-acetylmuramic acid kinase